MLSNFVVQHLKERWRGSEKSQDYKIIYHFCNIRVEQKYQTAEAVIRSLIVQLCEDCQLFLRLPCTLRETGFHNSQFDSLCYHFKNLVSVGTFETLYCIIDGLDVYGAGVKQLAENFTKLHSSTITGAPCLKLFFTSRPTPDLPPSPESRLLRSHPEDLRIFIESRVNSMSSDVGPKIRIVIIEKLKEKAGQTFLWVAIILRKILQIAKTRTTVREIDVLSVIASSNKDLDSIYEDLVRRAIENDPVNALIFTWVAFARRTFSVKTLSEAISVGQKDPYELTVDQLERKVGVLLDIVESTYLGRVETRVYLIHQSLRDFFITKMPKEMRDQMKHDPELYLAETCTRYLSTYLGEVDYDYDAFFTYARHYWYVHIHTVSDATMLLQYLEQILHPGSEKAKKWMNNLYNPRRILTLKDVAMYYDLDWLAEMILNKVSNSLADEIVPNDLIAASKFGVKVLDVLLTHEETTRFPITEAVVQAAAGVCHPRKALTLLFDRRGEDIQITEKVLCEAAESCWRGEQLLRLLFARQGGKIQITEKVLCAAATNPMFGEELMTLLFDQRGEDIQVTEEVVCTAAMNRERQMTILLDRRGEDIKITRGVIRSIASNREDGEQILTMLLDRRREELGALMTKEFHYPIETQLLGDVQRSGPIRKVLVRKAARCPSKTSIIALLLDRQGRDYLSGEIARFIIDAIRIHDHEALQKLRSKLPWYMYGCDSESHEEEHWWVLALAERRRQAIIELSIAPS